MAILLAAAGNIRGQTVPGGFSGVSPRLEYVKKQAFALRTNMLADLVGAANLGVEVPIGERFSAAGDFLYAYTRIKNHFAVQAIQGTVEGRYWFGGRRNKLTGWNVGVYTTLSGRFDIQWGGGWQGDGYWSVGVSGGYSLPICDDLNLDFSVMGGWFYSPEMRKYRPVGDVLIWQQTRYNVHRVIPTQVRVGLVWLIDKKRRDK